MVQIALNDENYLAVSKYYYQVYMTKRVSEGSQLREEVRREEKGAHKFRFFFVLFFRTYFRVIFFSIFHIDVEKCFAFPVSCPI